MSRRVGLTSSVAFDDFDDDDEEEDEERRSTSEEEEKKEEKRKESNPLVLERENEEEEDVRCFDAAKTLTTTLTTLTAARKVLKYDEDEDDDEYGRGRSGRRNDEDEEEEEEEKIMERHERNVRDVLRKTIATEEEEDFEEEEKRDVEMTTRHHVSTEKDGNEDDEEEEDDVGAMVRTMMMANAGNEDALTTTRTTTTTGPASPPKRFQSAFDVARRALKEENYRSTRNGIPPMITKDKSKEQSVPTLVVDAHAFGGKAFRGSWAGTSGRFAFCDGSKIVERTVATIKDDTEDGAVDEEEVKRRMLFQARAIKNGLKCFDAFSDKENHPRCRLHVPPEDVREFCRVHCEALANALMVFSNSNSSNSHSNDDSSKTSRRRTASKTKRAIELWDLLELLYKKDELGAQRGSAADTFRRKQNLSKWLKRSLKRAEKEKATEMDAQPMDFDDDEYNNNNNNNNNKSFSPRKENNNDPVSVALSRNDVVLATQLAMNDGDIRLATIIAQSGASDNIKNLANAQLNAWENAFGTATHKFIPSATRSVMELLAGRVETMSSEDGTSRNSTPESKDWIENLSKRVWFHHNVAETTERILERYERDILEDGAALFPHPCGMSEDALVEHKCEGIVKDARYDALLLTSSAAVANISNAHPFHQLGFGEDFLEFSNSWMATQFVLSQQSSSAMSQESELSRRGDQYTENLIGQISQLNAYFANDEENTEENRVPPKIECEWLLFVALFIRNDSKRERACKRILTETVREWRKSAVKLDVLARKFQVPKNWFDEANEAKRNVEKPALTNSLYR